MIVVDTSVWVTALSDATHEDAVRLAALLDADEVALPLPVRIELLAGVARPQRVPLERALRGLPVLVPDDDAWRRIESWIPQAADHGHRFGLSDLIIAAMTAELGGLVWSRDADFDRMEALGLVRLYR